MRIVVCMKQAYDPKTVKISRSREEYDLREAAKITNTPDKYALEAALRLREANSGEVVALTVGDAGAEDVAREAVAMGADRAVLVVGPEFATAGGRAVTKALAAAIGRLSPVDLVLTGWAGLTDGAGSLAPRLAAALGWPVAIDAAITAEGGAVAPSAVVAVAPGTERPRYPHPARIATAWEPGLVEMCTAQDLGLDVEALASDVEAGGLVLPPERTRGQIIAGGMQKAAAELADVLKARHLT